MHPALLRLRNAVDYPLRQWFRWRRGGFVPAPGPKQGLFDALPAARRGEAAALETRLRQEYRLDGFKEVASAQNYRENLFYLDMLERGLQASGVELPDPLLAADIGPSHWFYVQGLYALLRWWRQPAGREARLEGYEADAYRVYTDLRSRLDHAAGHLRGLSAASYIPSAFQAQPGRFHLILMLFPFVFERDHLEWGLPGRLFHPDALLGAAWDSLAPGGLLLVVNQGEDEHARQRERMRQAGIEPLAAFLQDDLLYAYAYRRYVLVARR